MVTGPWLWLVRGARYASIILVVIYLAAVLKLAPGRTHWLALFAAPLVLLATRALWRRSWWRALDDGLKSRAAVLAGAVTLIAAILTVAPFMHSFDMRSIMGLWMLGGIISVTAAYLFELAGVLVRWDDDR